MMGDTPAPKLPFYEALEQAERWHVWIRRIGWNARQWVVLAKPNVARDTVVRLSQPPDPIASRIENDPVSSYRIYDLDVWGTDQHQLALLADLRTNSIKPWQPLNEDITARDWITSFDAPLPEWRGR